MSDENNNANERFERIEKNLAETSERLAEINKMQLRAEFELAERRKQSEKEWAKIHAAQTQNEKAIAEIHATINHVVQLIRYFGDKSFEFDTKFKQAGEIMATDKVTNK